MIREIAGALRYGAHHGLILNAAAAVTAGVLPGANHVLPAALGRAGESAARRLGGQRIERVVFVTTKADHVPALKRDNLRHLLRSLSGLAEARQSALDAQVTYQVAASLLSTEDGTAKLDGHQCRWSVASILARTR